jgi:hypothetical protein
MSDLRRRLEEIDGLDMPDGWEDIRRRQARADLPIGLDRPKRASAPKVGVALLAFAVFVAAGALLWTGFHAGSSPAGGAESAPPTTGLDTYVNPMGIPITVDYPDAWYAQSVSQDTNLDPAAPGSPQIGLVISNVAEAMPSPGAVTPSPGPLPEDPNVPNDFVTVTILFDDGMGRKLPVRPDSPLPLSMSDAAVVPGPANIRVLEATVAGDPLTIRVQSGPAASRADLAKADEIVGSIRPFASGTSTSPKTSSAPNPLDWPPLKAVQLVSQRVVRSTKNALVVQAPVGKVQWTMSACDVSGRPVGGPGAGGFGGECGGSPLTASAGGLTVDHVFYNVLNGNAFFGSDVTIKVSFVGGTKTMVQSRDGRWMVVFIPDPANGLYAPTSHVATVTAVSGTGHVLGTVQVP